jgi:hypothetical protein
MKADEVAQTLGNHHVQVDGLKSDNPYRFVWLDGCSTAKTRKWYQAFGIYPRGLADRNRVGPQAFVGWADETGNALYTAAHADTLDFIYTLWMGGGFPLAACLQWGSDPKANAMPLGVPGNNWFTIDGIKHHQWTCKLIVVGHAGLTVDGWDESYDLFRPYLSPF